MDMNIDIDINKLIYTIIYHLDINDHVFETSHVVPLMLHVLLFTDLLHIFFLALTRKKVKSTKEVYLKSETTVSSYS